MEFRLTQNSQSVVGAWSDGHRAKFWAGELKGTVRERKLFVQFCSDGSWGNEPHVCPDFEQESDYLIQRGNRLVWYRKSDTGFRRYVKLHRVTKGKPVPQDNRCPEE